MFRIVPCFDFSMWANLNKKKKKKMEADNERKLDIIYQASNILFCSFKIFKCVINCSYSVNKQIDNFYRMQKFCIVNNMASL